MFFLGISLDIVVFVKVLDIREIMVIGSLVFKDMGNNI